jgi:spermidine/putrescine transport system substrate-binding protein
MDRNEFETLLHDFQRGRISRRQLIQVAGVGVASAIIAACAPAAVGPTPGATVQATAQPSAGATPVPTIDINADWTPPKGVDLGDTVGVTTWPNYHDPKTLARFKELTGVTVELTIFGSNEEMLALLLVGGTGWDVLVPTNYTFKTYAGVGIIEKLDFTKIPRYDAARYDARLLTPAFYPAGSANQYGFNKDWGTTGFTVNTKHVTTPITTWKEFFARAQTDLSGKVMIHDYQLTSIGSALVAVGHSFNSVDKAELAEAEALLKAVKPHLFAINSDYQPSMRNGDAWVSMTWTNDAVQLHRDIPEIEYIIAADGGEIWSDFFTILSTAPHREAAYAFLDFMATPKVMAQDAIFHGSPLLDKAAIALLPATSTGNKISYPDTASLSKLEFGTAELLTSQARSDLWARVKSSA